MPSLIAPTRGIVTCRLRNVETGEVWIDSYPNLIGDVGDLYFAQKMAAGVPPGNLPNPNLINGVKLGTGSVAPQKNGVNAVLGAYIGTSNASLDALGTPGYGGGPYPIVSNTLGAGNGVMSIYVVSYPAGGLINAAIAEAVLVTDAGVNATSATSQTISRALIGPYNKTAVLELDIVWQHIHLGA